METTKELETYRKFVKDIHTARMTYEKVYHLLKDNPILCRVLSTNIYSAETLLSKIDHEESKYGAMYEKQALCDHEAGKESYSGSDSHKDYYTTKCKKCGLILNERDC